MTQIHVRRTVSAEAGSHNHNLSRFELGGLIVAAVLSGVIFGIAGGLVLSGEIPEPKAVHVTR